jgi:hypothetical protein
MISYLVDIVAIHEGIETAENCIHAHDNVHCVLHC